MKMKLGEMEMDTESGISVSDSESSEPDTPPVPDERYEDVELAGLSLPKFSPGQYRAIAIASAAGAVLLGAGAVSGLVSPLALVPTLCLSVAIPASLVLAARVQSGDSNGPDVSERLDGRQRRLLDELERADAPQRVESLGDSLDWSERETVDVLASLVERDLVDEDLDVDEGHWVYESTRTHDEFEKIERESLPIDERREALAETNDS